MPNVQKPIFNIVILTEQYVIATISSPTPHYPKKKCKPGEGTGKGHDVFIKRALSCCSKKGTT